MIIASSCGTAAGVCAGLTFAVAASAKLRHRATLEAVIANYRLLDRRAIRPVALVLPWAEGAIGLLLVAGGGPGALAAVPGMALLLLFAAAMEVNIRRGRSHIDCGCGIGGLHQPLRRSLISRNLALAASLLPLALTGGALEPAAHAAAAAAGAAAFLLLLILDALSTMPRVRPVA